MKGPNYYNNENGSLYKFCEQMGLNSYEFDILKRVIRCRKKGKFKDDLEKTKFLIDLYLKEEGDSYPFKEGSDRRCPQPTLTQHLPPDSQYSRS